MSKFFFSFRSTTYKQFGQLFDKDESVNDEESITRNVKAETLQDKYGWYSILYNLSGENVLNIKKVTLIPIYETLTFLCYQMDYQREMKKQQKNSII